jgi:hypothetical protein
MNKRSVFAVAAAVVISGTVSGCFKHTFTVGSGAPFTREGIVYNKWRAHHLYGLISNRKALKISELCPSGNATIYERTSFINGLISGVIGFAFAPTTVTVWCAGKTASLQLDAAEVVAIVKAPLFSEWVREIAPDRVNEVATAITRLQTGNAPQSVAMLPQ